MGGRDSLSLFIMSSCPLENSRRLARSEGGHWILVLELLEVLKVIKMKRVDMKGSFLVLVRLLYSCRIKAGVSLVAILAILAVALLVFSIVFLTLAIAFAIVCSLPVPVFSCFFYLAYFLTSDRTAFNTVFGGRLNILGLSGFSGQIFHLVNLCPV